MEDPVDVEAYHEEGYDPKNYIDDYLGFLLSLLFIQVIYEYYLSYNFLVLIIRAIHIVCFVTRRICVHILFTINLTAVYLKLAGLRYIDSTRIHDINKAKMLFTMNLMTNIPITILQFFYGPFRSLMIIFIGSSMYQ